MNARFNSDFFKRMLKYVGYGEKFVILFKKTTYSNDFTSVLLNEDELQKITTPEHLSSVHKIYFDFFVYIYQEFDGTLCYLRDI